MPNVKSLVCIVAHLSLARYKLIHTYVHTLVVPFLSHTHKRVTLHTGLHNLLSFPLSFNKIDLTIHTASKKSCLVWALSPLLSSALSLSHHSSAMTLSLAHNTSSLLKVSRYRLLSFTGKSLPRVVSICCHYFLTFQVLIN